MNLAQNKKALIAMSGGVDSSVAAFLMRERGFECAGVTMKLFDDDEARTAGGQSRGARSCCSLSDVNDARDVAARLAIPHYILNLKKEFERDVIQKFIRIYEEGGTPNPCIDCNRFLKFNMLLFRARELDFHYLATGHYAQIENSGSRYLLKKGRDAGKDQSYALYTMTQEQLARTIFPLGALTKSEVRAIAREQSFINAHKNDSQDICFVPNGDYGSFIERHTQKKYEHGNILNEAGAVIGRHKGYVRYTKGQRRGLGVSSPTALYVCAKSPEHNTITLGAESSLYTKTLFVRDINLIAVDAINAPLRVAVKTRYMQREEAAVAEQTAPDMLRVDFEKPQRAITAGQAAVLYLDDVVAGGGTIV